MACDFSTGFGDNYTDGGAGGAGLANVNGAQRHLETQNFVFCDGHVKSYKGANANTSAKVWNVVTPRTQSLGDPTFNVGTSN